MSSNLERFIRKNRKEFDAEHPSETVWDEIEKAIPVKKESRRFSMRDMIKWSVAAAILVTIITSVYFLYIKDSREKQPLVTEESVTPGRPDIEDLSSITPEYAVQLKKVVASVEARQQELKAAASDLPSLYKQFEEDLKALDSSYAALKNQAAHTPNRDVLIRAMIQNLQLQAELLERQLQVIQEFKNTQTPKNEKTI